MVELSKRNAEFNDVSNQTTFHIMSAQEIEFDDNTFDYAVGLGALHHLNLDLAGAEIARVLKPGGSAIFIEPRLPFKWLVRLRSILPNKCY
jgi:ubiquinone/menaquinone biosynthesis C-methylase UbiE